MLFLGREPRRPIGGREREAEADAFENQVARLDGRGLARPGAVSIAAEELGANRGGLEDKDLLNAGHGRIGPDIGPGFSLIARGEDLNQEDRVSERAFLCVVPGTSNGEVGDSDIGVRLNAGDHTGGCDDAAVARLFLEVASDEITEGGLNSAVGDAGWSHSLRLAVDQLPELGRGRVPGEELRDGHPNRDLGQCAHAGILTKNRMKRKPPGL